MDYKDIVNRYPDLSLQGIRDHTAERAIIDELTSEVYADNDVEQVTCAGYELHGDGSVKSMTLELLSASADVVLVKDLTYAEGVLFVGTEGMPVSAAVVDYRSNETELVFASGVITNIFLDPSGGLWARRAMWLT